MQLEMSAAGDGPFVLPPSSITDNKVGRRLVLVPRDQQKLLDREDSWAEKLKSQPHGLYNIPASVVEGVAAAEQERRKPAPQRLQPSIEQPTAPPLRSPKSGQAENENIENIQQGRAGSEESHSSRVSWSISPEQRTKQTKPRPILPKIDLCAFPSSNGTPEPEMELAVPDAVDRPLRGVNKLATLVMTPPSAQVIPCTYSNTSSAPKQATPTPKRHRPMKSIDFKEQERKKRLKTKPHPTSRSPSRSDSPSSTAPTPRVEAERRRAIATIPATDPESAHRLVRENIPDTILVPDTVRPQVKKTCQLQACEEDNLISATIQRGGIGASEHIAEPVAVEEAHAPISRPFGPLWPYETYQLAYPEYKGSVGDFVKALLCIKSLQKNGSVASFLYDDIIRAFVEGFLPYVQAQDDTSEETLGLLMWYNQETKELRYNSSVVTSENLDGIMNTEVYRAELQATKGSISQSTSTDARRSYSARGSLSSEVEVSDAETGEEPQMEELRIEEPEPRHKLLAESRPCTDHNTAEVVHTSSSPGGQIPDSQSASPSGAESSFRLPLKSQVSPRTFATPTPTATQKRPLQQRETAPPKRPVAQPAVSATPAIRSLGSTPGSSRSSTISSMKRRRETEAERRARWIKHVEALAASNPSSARSSFGG